MMMSRYFDVRSMTCVCLFAFATSANANVFDTYGQGASTVAIGNATTAGGPSAFAAYSNPAALTLSNRSEIASSVLRAQFRLHNLPDDKSSTLPSPSQQAADAGDLSGGSLGLNLKLNESLHFGLAAYLPQGDLGRIRGYSPRQTTYLRFDEQQQKPSAYTALALKLPAGFAIGAGAYYSLRAKGILTVNLGSNESEGRVDFVMEPVIVPYGGLLWQRERLRLGAFYRQAQESTTEINSALAFSTDDATIPFEASTSLVPFFDPAQTRLGIAWEDARYALYASVEQSNWSEFKAPVVSISGNDVAALSQTTSARSAGLRDTQAYRIGAALPSPFSSFTALDLKAGYEYHTSANRRGQRSAIVDPTRQTLAVGAAWNFAPDNAGRRLAIEGAYQFNQLTSQQTYSSSGLAVGSVNGSSIHAFSGGLNYAL